MLQVIEKFARISGKIEQHLASERNRASKTSFPIWLQPGVAAKCVNLILLAVGQSLVWKTVTLSSLW